MAGDRINVANWVIAIATVVNVAVVACSGFVAYLQWNELQKAGKRTDRLIAASESAFVFLKQAYATAVYSTDGDVAGWDFHTVWENSGPTPTQNLVTYKNRMVFQDSMPDDFEFPDIVRGGGKRSVKRTFIGPKAVKENSSFYLSNVALDQIARSEKRLYVWGWAEYSSVYPPNKRSRSEFCFEIVARGNLKTPPSDNVRPPFRFVACDKHNGSERECFRAQGEPIPVLRVP